MNKPHYDLVTIGGLFSHGVGRRPIFGCLSFRYINFHHLNGQPGTPLGTVTFSHVEN